MWRYRTRRAARLPLVALFWLLPALGQQLPTSAGMAASDASQPASAQAQLASSSTALSTGQLFQLLRDKPELVIDLKGFAAERLQVRDDAITDEMLFDRIAADPRLRSEITLWLRARGYLSDMDIAGSRSMDDDGPEMPPVMPSLPPTVPDSSSLSQAQGLSLAPGQDSVITQEQLDALRARSSSPDQNDPPELRRRPPNDSVDSRANTNSAESQRTSPEPQILRRPTPYNLLSLRDLYTQMPEQRTRLKRFGADIFQSRGMQSNTNPLDLPVGPDYVLGPGDSLNIDIWGGLSQRISRTVDREGRVALPEAGPLVVAGMTLERVQNAIREVLTPQFRNARVEVSVARLRTVRVYIVGDVQRPGAYDISSLSSPINALYAAGGPTQVGSLRTVRHLRGEQLVREVDLYDFMLHGIRTDERLQSGDTILVPPASAQVTVAGIVRRPAIYELKKESNLLDVLGLAGGASVSASLSEIKVERIESHARRVTLGVNLPKGGDEDAINHALASFAIQDGDRVTVAPILPYSERTIYLDGHVFRPGRLSFHDGMTVNEVLRYYQDVLPEPADHAEIVRLVPPDFHPQTIQFRLSDILDGDDPITLQPFDTIRVYGRYEADAPKVSIRGEVLRPGVYDMPHNMTAAELVRMAGGVKRSALLGRADVASYQVDESSRIAIKHTAIDIGRALDDSKADLRLKPGDVLTIHQLSGWQDIGAAITLNGEVLYPGVYGIQEGERLSSVLKRAGGFRTTAYPAGAVLERTQVKELEEKGRAELIRQIETSSATARVSPTALSGQDSAAMVQAVVQQRQQVLERLRNQTSTGRLVIKISPDVKTWENTPVDIELRAGDVLTIPKRPNFVLVNGQVYNPAALTYVPGKNADWYLRQAGGATGMANKGEVFIVRANGSVVGRESGEWYKGDVLSTKMQPGDVIVVPQKIIGGSMVWKNMLNTAQFLSSLAITARVALSF
jgi:protein involved in polysaccharide export with SLBB domain